MIYRRTTAIKTVSWHSSGGNPIFSRVHIWTRPTPSHLSRPF